MIKTEKYNIYINDFSSINELINSYSTIFLLVDENTEKYGLPVLQKYLDIQNINLIRINSGEENKNIDTCCYIWKQLSELKAERKSLMINLGGGVIGDMGGFCASTFKRGIDFVNIPTTLLSQVDASIGGKLGIDFDNLKNQIGLFNDPKAVFISNEFLKTLDSRQILSGYAEIIKHGLILDSDYWQIIKQNDISNIKNLDTLMGLVKSSVELKHQVVLQDPLEKNIRKSLNFGHTIGHAIETFSLMNDNVPLLHGESIAIGLICESYLSYLKNNLSKNELNEITHFINSIYQKYDLQEINYNKIIDLMSNDKKNENNNINFTCINKIGSFVINQNFSNHEIIDSLHYYNSF